MYFGDDYCYHPGLLYIHKTHFGQISPALFHDDRNMENNFEEHIVSINRKKNILGSERQS